MGELEEMAEQNMAQMEVTLKDYERIRLFEDKKDEENKGLSIKNVPHPEKIDIDGKESQEYHS